MVSSCKKLVLLGGWRGTGRKVNVVLQARKGPTMGLQIIW